MASLVTVLAAAFGIFAVFEEASALTLDEALTLAKEALPSYRATTYRVQSSEELYKATLSPYFPTINASANWNRHYSSPAEFPTQAYGLTALYTLFDGGKRRAERNIAGLALQSDREEARRQLIDLEYTVKVAFHTVLARRDILEQRRIQVKDAEKDHEVAQGRYTLGVAKLSDVLQASVRLEQARFNVVQAEGDYKKAVSDLSSLIGKPLGSEYEVTGSLEAETSLPGREVFLKAAHERPEIRQAEDALRISEQNYALSRSTFFPTVSASASYENSTGGFRGLAEGQGIFAEEYILGITASWNIFELGRFFKYRSADIEQSVSQANLDETRRQLLLAVDRAYEDAMTSAKKIAVAQQQLRHAEHNYSQAFGEYKVGKSDIIALVAAESFLSTSREQLTTSRMDLLNSRAFLERAAGITHWGAR